MVTLSEVRDAAERIRPFVVRTPLERSVGLSALYGTNVWLKFECFQTTGSFKLRGALNALLTMSEQQRQNGVGTASAGNPGWGGARGGAVGRGPATVARPGQPSPAT